MDIDIALRLVIAASWLARILLQRRQTGQVTPLISHSIHTAVTDDADELVYK